MEAVIKFLPILVRQADKVSGLIVTSLLDMPNITSGSTAQQMCVCYEVREAFSLDWNNCVMYSSDNTNSMIGQHNKKSEKKQNLHSENMKSKRWPKDFWCWLPLWFSTFVGWKGSQRTFCKCWGFCYWHILSGVENKQTS